MVVRHWGLIAFTFEIKKWCSQEHYNYSLQNFFLVPIPVYCSMLQNCFFFFQEYVSDHLLHLPESTVTRMWPKCESTVSHMQLLLFTLQSHVVENESYSRHLGIDMSYFVTRCKWLKKSVTETISWVILGQNKDAIFWSPLWRLWYRDCLCQGRYMCRRDFSHMSLSPS